MHSCITPKQKTRTLASSRFEAVCVNLLSSAVDRREVLGVAVGEWSDIVFCYTILQNRPVNYLKTENEISKCSQIVAKIRFYGEKKNPKSLFYSNLGLILSGATRKHYQACNLLCISVIDV